MPRTNEQQLAARAWASKPRVLPGPAIPWPKAEALPAKPKPVAAPAKPKPARVYAASAQGYQRALFDFLWQQKAHRGQLGYARQDLAQRLQHAVDPLVNQGVVERRYDRFKTWSGKQKICYLTLLTKTDLPESYLRNLVTLSPGPP